MRVITDLQIVYENQPHGGQKRVLRASYADIAEISGVEAEQTGEFTVCEIPPKQYSDCE